MSIKHVNEAFNDCGQADYTIIYINNGKFEVLNIFDVGTTYIEQCIAPSRSSDHVKIVYESMWMCRYGAPERFAADPELYMENMKKFSFRTRNYVRRTASSVFL